MQKNMFKSNFEVSGDFARFIRFAAEIELKAKRPTFAEIYFLCNSLHLFPYNG